MVYENSAFEARRKQLLGGITTNASSQTNRAGSFADPAFEQRRVQILSQPAPISKPAPAPAPIASKPNLLQQAASVFKPVKLASPVPESQLSKPQPKPSLFKQISDLVMNKLNQSVPGGVSAGVQRVKTAFKEGELNPLTATDKVSTAARQYVGDTAKVAVETIKGAGKLTPAYSLYRSALGNPVTPKEYAKTVLTTGLNFLNLSWWVSPAAPITGAGFESWKAVRQYFQGKIDAGDLIEAPLKGVNNQPGFGEVFTDNVRWAEAIDIVFVASMFAKPFVSKKLNSLNMKADELKSVTEILGVKPNATLEEASAAFKKKIKLYPDTFTSNPNPEHMKIRIQLTDAYNTFKKYNVLDKAYAQAYDFVSSVTGKERIKTEPLKPEVKQLPGKIPEVGEVKPTVPNAPKSALTVEKPVIKLPKTYGSEVEKKSYLKLANEPEKMVTEYIQKNGNIIDSDRAKDLFRDTGYDKTGINSDEVHKPSGQLAFQAYKQALTQFKGTDGNEVLQLIGGSGAGKSSATLNAIDKTAKDFSIVNDSTGSIYDNFKGSLDMSVEAGYKPAVAYVYRDPVDALVNGVFKRDRFVSIESLIATHSASKENIIRAIEEYQDKGVKFYIIDNSLGEGKAKLVPTKQVLAFLNKINYDTELLEKELKNETIKAYEAKRISEAFKNKLLGVSPGSKGIESGKKPQRVGKEQKKNIVTPPKEKVVWNKTETELLDTLRASIASEIGQDFIGSRDLYVAISDQVREIPKFGDIVAEVQKAQEAEIEAVKAEIKADGGDAEAPTTRLLEIADKLILHFKTKGGIFQITGKGKGDAATAFDKLIFATDIEGFAKQIKELAARFNGEYTEISNSIAHGDIDGGDYEAFKNRIQDNRQEQAKSIRSRLTPKVEPVKKQAPESSQRVTKPTAVKEKIDQKKTLLSMRSGTGEFKTGEMYKQTAEPQAAKVMIVSKTGDEIKGWYVHKGSLSSATFKASELEPYTVSEKAKRSVLKNFGLEVEPPKGVGEIKAGETNLLGEEIKKPKAKPTQSSMLDVIGEGKMSTAERIRLMEANKKAPTGGIEGTAIGTEIERETIKKQHGGGLFSGDLGYNPKTQKIEVSEVIKEPEKLIKQSEIAKALSEKLGVPIRRGKFRSGGAIGIFKPRPKVVRIKSGGLSTVFHEVGHFLDDQFKLSDTINIKERKALMSEYGIEYKNQPRRQRQEALAEFIRFKMTGQDKKAQGFAPKFYEEWDKRMDALPEVKAVIDQATQDFKRWMAQPASAKVLSHISTGKQSKGSLINRATAGLHDLYTIGLDDLHPLSQFSVLAKKQLGVIPSEKDPYILARTLRGWVGKAELFLTKGTFAKNFWTVDEKGKSHINFTGKSYSEIMRPIEAKHLENDFRVYIVSKRVIELSKRGIRTGIDRRDAQEALAEQTKAHPEFEAISNERLAYKDALLSYAASPANGLIGEDGLARIKQLNKFHVPFYRVMEETSPGGFMGRRKMAGNLGSPIKKIKGSEREIIDPLESDIKDTYAIINASERNSIGVAMANLASRNFELGRLFEEVVRPMVPVKVNAKEVMDKLLKETGEELEIPEELADLTVTLFRPTYDSGPNMLNVNMGDKKKVFQVDPSLFKAIQGLNLEDVGLIMKVLAMPSQLLRAGATLTPDFSLRNPVRDQFSAFIYSNYGFIPGFDLMRGMFETFAKGEVYNLWKAGGGEHTMLVSMDREVLQKTYKDLYRTKISTVKNLITHPIKMLQIISEFGEQATRLGEMKRALEHGATPVTAAFSSREITTDFAKIGAKTKALNLLITFWNANVQGLDRMVRAFKDKPFRTLFKTLMGITLPSILLYLANRKDKRWNEIPGWQKNLFWIVMTPEHVYRIPKPFEIGILFGSVPERIMEYIDTQNPKLFDQLLADVANGATPGFIPTVLLPVIENISNYSFFNNRPIVPSGKTGLPPEAQAGNYTSELAKLIGETLKYSPSKIDNLIQGYSGGLGRYTVNAIDKVLIGTGISTPAPKPAKALEDIPVIKAFMIREPVGTGSESVNEIYNLSEEVGGQITYVKKLIEAGDQEKAKAYIKAHPEIVMVGIVNSTVQAFSDINRVRDQLMNNRTMTPEAKQQKINALDKLQTDIAQKALKQIQYAGKGR